MTTNTDIKSEFLLKICHICHNCLLLNLLPTDWAASSKIFILDKIKKNKIPVDLHGDHLSLHMTFILMPNNNLKNIQAIFNHSDLKVERIISRPFVEGIHLLNHKKNFQFLLLA